MATDTDQRIGRSPLAFLERDGTPYLSWGVPAPVGDTTPLVPAPAPLTEPDGNAPDEWEEDVDKLLFFIQNRIILNKEKAALTDAQACDDYLAVAPEDADGDDLDDEEQEELALGADREDSFDEMNAGWCE